MSKNTKQKVAAQENRQFINLAWCPGTRAYTKRKGKLAKQQFRKVDNK